MAVVANVFTGDSSGLLHPPTFLPLSGKERPEGGGSRTPTSMTHNDRLIALIILT